MRSGERVKDLVFYHQEYVQLGIVMMFGHKQG